MTSTSESDIRFCVLCRGKSEADNSRFLYCGQNSWIHANCALYSAEVFEEIDGSLQNVHSAISRGPVYVELDRKRKKMIEPSKVRFYLGSLSIEKLGGIVPSLSGSVDAIVPSDFQCARLYWSTQEPRKNTKLMNWI